MDYIYDVSRRVAVGALTVVAGSAGFTLSILSLALNYIIPGQFPPVTTDHSNALPVPKHPEQTQGQSPRSSVGSFLSQSTTSDATVPSAHRVTFHESLAVPPGSDLQLRLPRERSRSRIRPERVRSLSPIADTSPVSATPRLVQENVAPILVQENVASTSAVRLDSAVVDPLVPQKQCKGKNPLRILGKGLASAKIDRKKKLQRSLSTPAPSLAKGKEKIVTFSSEDGEPTVSPSAGKRREKKEPGVAFPECQKTHSRRSSDHTQERGSSQEGEHNLLRAGSVDRCLHKKPTRTTSLPTLPQRTNPYSAPYFFPQPGSPEAQDYVRKVREERLRVSKTSNSSLRSYFHLPPTPSSATSPSPASVSSTLPPSMPGTPPASRGRSPRGRGERERLPPTLEEVDGALASRGLPTPPAGASTSASASPRALFKRTNSNA